MSRFFSNKFNSLEAYTPGEQPQDKSYIKLNTNESPFPPSPAVIEAVSGEVGRLQLYSDPECKLLVNKFAEVYGIKPEQVVMTNGSDEALYFSFLAFSDAERPIVFPDITYGFYPVFAKLIGIPFEEIPLSDDLSVRVEDYVGIGKNIVLANPNAPTGKCLSLADIERIVASNPDNVVIIDEAYVDFGGESAVSLIEKYNNLIVTGTFSKSRSLAGARLGFAISNKEIVKDLNTVRFSTNPYNINRMTMAAGYAALSENSYYMDNCRTIIENREYTAEALRRLGFEVVPSSANFLFVKSREVSGERLYRDLKAMGILVRHFSGERIREYNRITVGTREQMDALIYAVKLILKRI